MKPELIRGITIELFRDYYWLKEDLQDFCRDNGMSATGSKGDLTDRVETFILTGERKKPIRQRKSKPNVLEELTLDTVITEGHTCSQQVRYFFMSIIPKFHFSTHIQQYFKQNVGKTYSDVVDEWYREEERKKDPNFRKEIAPQFEYNTFIRDFFSDPQNRGKSRSDAIVLWNTVKSQPGSNKYTPQ